MNQDVLALNAVTKRYGDLVAVDDVSLRIPPGEILALLGPNGAGKTTLIGCVTGLTTGFEGEITVAGHDVVRDYRVTRRLVGLVPQELNYDAFFTVRQSLEYQSGYFGLSSSRSEIDGMLERFALTEKANDRSRWLSGGMKRRLMICKALVHDPVLLFLDEPTAGVDVDLREELWAYVRELRDRGTTIVLTTHYLEEAEALADRIGIIDRGRLVRVQERQAMLDEFGMRWGRVVLCAAPPAAFLEGLARRVMCEGHSLRVEWGDGEPDQLDDLIRRVHAAGLAVERIEAGRSSLEDVFRGLVTSRGES